MTLSRENAELSQAIDVASNVTEGTLFIPQANIVNVSGTVTANTGVFDLVEFNNATEIVPSEGQLTWDTTYGTLDIGFSDTYALHVGQETHFRARNETGGSIYKGQAVYATGVHSDNIRLEIDKYTADGNISELRFIGLVSEDIGDNSSGYVTNFGYIRGNTTYPLDTRGNVSSNVAVGDETWAQGDILYVHPSTAGKLTKVAPRDAISVAIIIRVHQTDGVILVRPTSYGHLTDLHDVDTSGVSNGQTLVYNSGTLTWEAGTISGGIANVVEDTTPQLGGDLDINNSNIIGSGNIATTGYIQVDNLKLDGNTLSSTNTNGALILNANGTGAIQADSGGNARGAYAVDLQRVRSAATQIASGSYSTVSGGQCNAASGSCSTVSGGRANSASGNYSAVSGGFGNSATGFYSTVGGGYSNSAGSTSSTISGGFDNSATGNSSTVGGGSVNVATGACSTISGGYQNRTTTFWATVGGGRSNCASECYSTVSGGCSNTASGINSIVGGGRNNTASGCWSIVGGGSGNNASAFFSTVSGGSTNTASVTGATVGGGYLNSAVANSSTVGGGYLNCASGACSTIGGGTVNTALGACSTISGGRSNCTSITASGSTISGGCGNSVSESFSTVSGGSANCASSSYSTVGGGFANTASGYSSTVGGGHSNTASGTNSSVSGGCSNVTNARHSTINGGHRNVIQSPTNECCSRGATIGGGVGHNSSGGTLNFVTGDLTGTITCCNAGAFSTIGGGLRNIATGGCSTVGGGYGNTASAYFSTVGGGYYNIATNDGVIGGSTVSGGILNCACGFYTTVSGGYANCASAQYSTVSGGTSNSASGTYSTVGGGYQNTASGSNSTVGGGIANSATGSYSTVGGGIFSCVSATGSTVSGGYCNVGQGYQSTVSGGRMNCATGSLSTVSGGYCNIASGSNSTVSGGLYSKASKYGELSHAAGRFAQTGDAQHSTLVARRNTTDATANQVLFLDGSSARLTIPAETTWMFSIKLAAHNDTNNDGAWWTFRGGIRRDASNNTSLIGSVISEYERDTNMATATASVVADDTNEALEIRVTGVAAKNIRWVAVVDISQVSWGTP